MLEFTLRIPSLQCGGVSLFNTCLARKLNWRLLPKTCCSMFKKSRSTDFTCAVSQAVRILNICKTFHEIQVPLNFLFKFTGINFFWSTLNLFNFIWFDYVVSVIFTCQMMSNFLKHPVYTGVYTYIYRCIYTSAYIQVLHIYIYIYTYTINQLNLRLQNLI